MKEQIWKWIKRYGVTAWLVIVVAALIVSGTYAAYINFDVVKRVVSTGKSERAYFSSNYLYLTGKDETAYSSRRIIPTQVKNDNGEVTGNSFTVQVCNYTYGNREAVNLNSFHYDFQVKAISITGDALPEGITDITVNGTPMGADGKLTIPNSFDAGIAKMDSYRFRVPEALRNKIKLEIVAEPRSYSATDNQKLAAVIILSDTTPGNTWTGRFIDDKNNLPAEYEGFNYEVSGHGAGTVTIQWNDKLQISPWVGATGNSYSFAVKDAETYQFQFYRANKPEFTINSWSEMESLITVSFEPIA